MQSRNAFSNEWIHDYINAFFKSARFRLSVNEAKYFIALAFSFCFRLSTNAFSPIAHTKTTEWEQQYMTLSFSFHLYTLETERSQNGAF